jgi:hypothetical protein
VETTLIVSASTDAVIKEMQIIDGVYSRLSKIIEVEFEQQQHQELLDLYLKDCLNLRASCLNLVRDLIGKQLVESNYKTI